MASLDHGFSNGSVCHDPSIQRYNTLPKRAAHRRPPVHLVIIAPETQIFSVSVLQLYRFTSAATDALDIIVDSSMRP